MAYQHFYSRVPARISLFNKTDGFDTFAHSAALSDEFIFRELSPIYTDKLSGFDVGSVRRGEISPIYFQHPVPSGGVVQSALSYIPRDYTGERSAYLVHSLVLDKEEQARVFDERGVFTAPLLIISPAVTVPSAVTKIFPVSTSPAPAVTLETS